MGASMIFLEGHIFYTKNHATKYEDGCVAREFEVELLEKKA